MALQQTVELDIAGKVEREALEEFISLLPADATISTIASRISGDRNMSDTYRVKLRAEWTVGKA
jgi:hypothetical protein